MSAAAGGPAVRAFFDEATNTVSYLAWDPATMRGAVIDPVLDWDNRSGEAHTGSADAVLRAAEAEGVAVDWVLETHVHADHLTAAPYVKSRTGASIGIGEHVRDVQTIFRPVFNAEDLAPECGDFDRLFHDGERIRARLAPGAGDARAGPHPGLRRLCGRRRGFRGRYAVHARLRHGALRLPGRQRAGAVAFDPAAPCLAAGDAGVHGA